MKLEKKSVCVMILMFIFCMGQPISGTHPGTAVTRTAERSLVQEQPTVFDHAYLTLSLPEGWVLKDIPSNFEKETIGWFGSTTISGASIMLFAYRGRRYNYSSIRIAGLKTLAASYPLGQEMLAEEKRIQTDQGLVARYELWKGLVDAGGQAVALQSPMAIIQLKQCWILMLGFVSDANGPQLEEGFLQILNTIQSK